MLRMPLFFFFIIYFEFIIFLLKIITNILFVKRCIMNVKAKGTLVERPLCLFFRIYLFVPGTFSLASSCAHIHTFFAACAARAGCSGARGC